MENPSNNKNNSNLKTIKEEKLVASVMMTAKDY